MKKYFLIVVVLFGCNQKQDLSYNYDKFMAADTMRSKYMNEAIQEQRQTIFDLQMENYKQADIHQYNAECLKKMADKFDDTCKKYYELTTPLN